MTNGRDDNDPLLAPLLASDASPADRRAALAELVARHLTPLVDDAVERLLRPPVATDADRADAAAEARLRLLRKLARLAVDPGDEPIRDLRDYAFATVHHLAEDLRRQRDPERARLTNRLRYLLSSTRWLAVWGRDPTLCARAEWRGRPPVDGPLELPHVDPEVLEDTSKLRRLVDQALRAAGGPVELLALREAIAEALGLPREPFVDATALRSQHSGDDPLSRLSGHQALARLLDEIGALPVRQRRALLLQLRMEDGDALARVLPALGLADVRRLATLLELPLDELLALWNDLPLPDLRIAEMLGVTRQQVINLRKAARERLARRMGRWS